MGAQTVNRLVQFQKRFAEWDDPTGSTPAYHYGTHYSSAMIVASYLVRTEPFTQVFLRLQVNIFSSKYLNKTFSFNRVVILILLIECFIALKIRGHQLVKTIWLMLKNLYRSFFIYLIFYLTQINLILV
jgi:hypothetical protein